MTPRYQVPEPKWRAGKSLRDWKDTAITVAVTIALSLGANVITGVWSTASFHAQVLNMEAHQKLQDESIKTTAEALKALLDRMPSDYVPRAEHIRNATLDKEIRDEERDRLSRLEQKVDQILANQIRPVNSRR